MRFLDVSEMRQGFLEHRSESSIKGIAIVYIFTIPSSFSACFWAAALVSLAAVAAAAAKLGCVVCCWNNLRSCLAAMNLINSSRSSSSSSDSCRHQSSVTKGWLYLNDKLTKLTELWSLVLDHLLVILIPVIVSPAAATLLEDPTRCIWWWMLLLALVLLLPLCVLPFEKNFSKLEENSGFRPKDPLSGRADLSGVFEREWWETTTCEISKWVHEMINFSRQ